MQDLHLARRQLGKHALLVDPVQLRVRRLHDRLQFVDIGALQHVRARHLTQRKDAHLLVRSEGGDQEAVGNSALARAAHELAFRRRQRPALPNVAQLDRMPVPCHILGEGVGLAQTLVAIDVPPRLRQAAQFENHGARLLGRRHHVPEPLEPLFAEMGPEHIEQRIPIGARLDPFEQLDHAQIPMSVKRMTLIRMTSNIMSYCTMSRNLGT